MTLDYLRLTGRDDGAGRSWSRRTRRRRACSARADDAGPDLHRDDRARSRDGRAEPRRAEAAAGSRVAEPGEVKFQQALERCCRAKPKAASKPASRRLASTRRRRGGRRRAAPRPSIDHGAVVDRRDHELHQHVEPERHDRRRPAGARRPSKRGLTMQAVGEDQPRARLEGRHRVPAKAPGLDAYLDAARLQPRRLRLHDLHRQQRSAARRRSSRTIEGHGTSSSRRC